MNFVLSPAARQDLHDIWDYVAQHDLDAADRLRDLFYETMTKIAEMPGLGQEHAFLADETLRVRRVHSYLIIYRPQTSPVQIVRVVSGYRDLTTLET